MATEVGAQRPAQGVGDVADRAWLSAVRNEVGTEPVLDDEGALVIQVRSGAAVPLEGAPQDRTIRLPDLGAHQQVVRLAAGPAVLHRVVVHAHAQLKELQIDASGRIDDLTVYAAEPSQRLGITGHGDLRTLRLRGGGFAIGSANLARSTTVVDLRDTSLERTDGAYGTPRELILGGRVEFRSPWRVPSSVMAPDTFIVAPSNHDLNFGIVNPEQQASDPPLALTLDTTGPCWFHYLPCATTLHLYGGQVVLRPRDPLHAEPSDTSTIRRFLLIQPDAIERLTVIGTGSVQIGWDLESPVFTPEGGELTLHIDGLGNVMNASGQTALGNLHGGVLCQGSPSSPLVVSRVSSEVADAEVERVDIYDLTVGDVRRLKTTARITPWIPGPWAARKRELAMRVGTSDRGLQRQRRADFWTQFSDILSEQQASGSVQSNVRVAAIRARRRALGYGRERFWLAAFSMIGYGERILLPLAVWLAGVVAAGVAYALVVDVPYGVVSVEFVKLLARLLAGPLAILRVEELRPQNAPGTWDTVIWVGAQVLSTICLGSALVAIRKVTRASH